MVFSSTVFLFLFLPITLLLYFNPLCQKREYRNIVLLIMSLGFYGWGEPVFIFIMLALIIVDWYTALFIEKSQDCCKKKIALFCTTVLHLSVFFIFKYLTFVCQNINYLLKTDKITELKRDDYTGTVSAIATKVLSAEDITKGKGLNYENISEIVQYTSLTGRRTTLPDENGGGGIIANANVNNWNGYNNKFEDDTDATEIITISPPTGLSQ